MLKLPVAALGTDMVPAVAFQKLDKFTNLHAVTAKLVRPNVRVERAAGSGQGASQAR